MIARSSAAEESAAWRKALRDAYREPASLLDDLGLASSDFDLDPAPRFPFRVTREYAARMVHGDARDPLLRQVLPLAQEGEEHAGFDGDPVGEHARLGDDSLLVKYSGRALLVLTGACAIHCRYCFRREFPYADTTGQRRLGRALERLAADSAVEEVILSGGDPLVLDDGPLFALVEALEAIPHLRRLRLHSRLPVVLPARLGPALLARLAAGRLATVLVIHANHANELDEATLAALRAARAAGLTLLNQSVLLAGVNDSADALAALSTRLFEAGVLPYYLHQLDPVRGTAHFAVDDGRASALVDDLRARLPGYLVPRLVREVAGAPAKLPLP